MLNLARLAPTYSLPSPSQIQSNQFNTPDYYSTTARYNRWVALVAPGSKKPHPAGDICQGY